MASWLDDVEDWAHRAERAAGKAVETGGHAVGGVLDDLGLHDWAQTVDSWIDVVGDRLGATPEEKNLGETDDPRQLVHGDPDRISEIAGDLQVFAQGFGEAAQALHRIDVGGWTGAGADAFHTVYAKHPEQWSDASQACDEAGKVLGAYAYAVLWAQGQAAAAIHQYAQAVQAGKTAVDDYNRQVQAFNNSDRKGPRPGAFTDPGKPMAESAQQILNDARAQRNTASATAARALAAAADLAPDLPGFADRMTTDVLDFGSERALGGIRQLAGFAGALGNLAKAGNAISPYNPYVWAHPLDAADSLQADAAGFVQISGDPVALVSSIVGDQDSWLSDPDKAGGTAAFNIASMFVGDGAGAEASAAAHGAEAGASVAAHGAEAGASTATHAAQAGATHAAETGAACASHSVPHHDPLPPEHAPSRPEDSVPLRDERPDCSGEGEPVDVATGAMYLPETDLVLPGVLPLRITRRYVTSYSAGHCFGRRWASSLDERVEVDTRGAVVVGPDADLVDYTHAPVGIPMRPQYRGQPRALTRCDYGGYRLDDPVTGITKHYYRIPGIPSPDGVYPLVAVSDRHHNHIVYKRDNTGRITELVHSGGYTVHVTTDPAGHVTAIDIADPSGLGGRIRLRAFGYDDHERLTHVIDGSGLAMVFAYDGDDRMTSWTDRNNYTYHYEYDEHGRVVTEGGADGTLAGGFEYLALPGGRSLTRYTNSFGDRTTYLIDENYQPVAVTDALGHTSATRYDEHRRPTAQIDRLGRETRYRHNDIGQITGVRRPDGRELFVDYHSPGKPSRVEQFDGTVTSYEYGDDGDLVATVDASGATTGFEHESTGGTWVVADPAGGHTLIDRNPAGLPIAVTDPAGGITRYHHDPFGRIVAVHRPDGTVTAVEWSVDGKPLRRIHPDGTSESWIWDAEGNLLSHTDAGGRTTGYTYGPFDKPTARIAPDGTVTRYRWDAETRLAAVTNPQGLTWVYTYDPCGRLASETDFDGLTTEYRYDAAGQLIARIRDGLEITYEYNELGDVVAERAPDGDVVYTHDVMGRIMTATGDVEVAFERDVLGRVTAEIIDGIRVESHYDIAGHRIRRTTPAGAVDYHHDYSGRLAAIETAGRRIDFEYDALGRETRRTLARDLVFETAWTPRDLPAEQTLTTGRTTGFSLELGLPSTPPLPAPEPERRLLERTYTYHPDTALASVHDTLGGTQAYTLDPVGRVTTVTGNRTESYSYDTAGNLTAGYASTPARTGDSTNEYRGTRLIRSGRSTWHHDSVGRPIHRTATRLSRKPETWHYEWDSRDRLCAVTTPDGNRWTYTYDPFGRRVRKAGTTTDGTVLDDIRFTWDGDHLIAQVDRSGNTTIWTHRPGSTTLLIQSETSIPEQGSVDERFYAIITDLVGGPANLIDPDTRSVAGHAMTTLWGQTTWAGAATPLRFPGQYFDAETGFHYNRHRYYHPAVGRYLTTDPLGLAPSPNPAAYASNPTGWIDPLGLAPAEGCGKQDSDPSRNEAFRDAKRDLDIPMSQHPDSVARVRLQDKWGQSILDDNGMPIYTREYSFTRPDGSRVVIQDHGAGHYYGPGDPGNQGPHLNVRPDWNTRTGKIDGTQEHYPFRR